MHRKTLLAVTMSLLMVLLPATTASAYRTMDTQYSGEELTLPAPDNEEDDCEQYDGCPEDLRGVSFRDYHVGPYIDDEDEDPAYVLTSEANIAWRIYYEEYVNWEVCLYDDQRQLLECNMHEGEWYNKEDISTDVEHLRLILRQGLAAEYTLGIYT